MQQIPDIEKTDSKEKISCLKKTMNKGRRKLLVIFKTDTDNLNFIMYHYRNNLHLKDNTVDLKLTDYQMLLAERVYL